MDLKEFVKQSLVEIAQAVDEANGVLLDMGACVNPESKSSVRVSGKPPVTSNQKIPTMIEFDVAVSAGKGKATRGGVGIVVGAIGLGSQGQSTADQSTQSRIKFSLRAILPTPKHQRPVK